MSELHLRRSAIVYVRQARATQVEHNRESTARQYDLAERAVKRGWRGIVLGLEVSRLARNNADWYRPLDLCGMTHTLIGDGDGISVRAPDGRSKAAPRSVAVPA